jgi:hypothetical protein
MSLSRRIKKLWARLAEPGALRLLYHGLALAPRLIVHIASIAALAGFVGACVPSTQYEEAKSASEVELARRERAEAELRVARGQIDALTEELTQRQQKLAETEQSVSETKFENSVAVKERDEATGMVDQLRGDLARVGDNLRSYAQQKADLEKSLAVLQAHKSELEQSETRTVAIARFTRDLTSALGDRVTSGDVQIDLKDGRIVLSAPPELWFDDGAALRAGSDAMLAAVSRVLALHPQTSLELGVAGADADKRSALLVAALGSRGVSAARVQLARSGPNAPAMPTPDAAIAAVSAKPVELAEPALIELSFSVG